MAVPQNIQDDLTALDAAYSTTSTDQTILNTATTAAQNANAAVTVAQMQVTADLASQASALQQLVTDLDAYYVANAPTPVPSDIAQKMKTLKNFKSSMHAKVDWKAVNTASSKLKKIDFSKVNWSQMLQIIEEILTALTPLIPATP